MTQLEREWEERLQAEGLGMEAGTSPLLTYVPRYLDSDAVRIAETNPLVHQYHVELLLQEEYRRSHQARADKRAALRREKAALREKIWATA